MQHSLKGQVGMERGNTYILVTIWIQVSNYKEDLTLNMSTERRTWGDQVVTAYSCVWVCERERQKEREKQTARQSLQYIKHFSMCWLPHTGACCEPMGHSLPSSSVHGILQARILEWVAMPSSRWSSWSGDQTQVSYISCICRILYH